MSIYSEMMHYCIQLEKRISFLEKKLSELPTNHLKYISKNGHLFFYERTSSPERISKYIKKGEREKLQKIVNAHYIKKCLPVLKQNLEASKLFLKAHSQTEEATIIENTPKEIREINSNLFPYKEGMIEEWQKRPFKRNPYMEENLTISTQRGEMVRSKSEAIIANMLYSNHIPYKVECPLKLKQKTIYPDFTILNPNTLEEVYWEHFGIMDNYEYAKNVCNKVNMYGENDIMLGKKLLVTFEAASYPLSSAQVERTIEQVLK